VRTIGVEEELLLVSSSGGEPTAVGDAVISAADQLAAIGALDPNAQLEHEFKQEQAEIASNPCTDLGRLRSELVELRTSMATAASQREALAVAIATSPVKVRPHQTDDGRYHRMNTEFGLLSRQQLTCGQHVHVSVESRDEGIAVIDRTRTWLPVLVALSANSPFWQGADTGYASYRTVLWSLWPSAGATDVFGTVAEYDRQVAALIATGAALDTGMIYYSARLSARFPTVEFRVADVCTDVDDAVLIAALCRALVDTAAGEWRRGEPPVAATAGLLRAATWRAARFGLSDELFDPGTGRRLDAWQLVDRLVDYVAEALAATGDADLVAAALARLRTRGTGSDLQRATATTTSGLHAVVLDAAKRTLAA
jgi:glutamate---cysteine ligase / carboxylate-amine ligase